MPIRRRVDRHELIAGSPELQRMGPVGTAYLTDDGRLLIELHPDELDRSGGYYTISPVEVPEAVDRGRWRRHTYDPGYSGAAGRRDSVYGPRKRRQKD